MEHEDGVIGTIKQYTYTDYSCNFGVVKLWFPISMKAKNMDYKPILFDMLVNLFRVYYTTLYWEYLMC